MNKTKDISEITTVLASNPVMQTLTIFFENNKDSEITTGEKHLFIIGWICHLNTCVMHIAALEMGKQTSKARVCESYEAIMKTLKNIEDKEIFEEIRELRSILMHRGFPFPAPNKNKEKQQKDQKLCEKYCAMSLTDLQSIFAKILGLVLKPLYGVSFGIGTPR
ncbi:MAG: hypothetical protein BA863_08930 [Desulfovibrio sp. S3730MH75]|nr:MAG: hypothetical protein BA863_08930 [Desulfovibrio sp. S3730MH75]